MPVSKITSQPTSRLRASTRVAIGLFLLSGLSGCGHKTVEVQGSSTDAVAIVERVLDAWKAGKSAADMKGSEPPIIVRDEDWEGGKTLKDYKITGETESNGSHWRIFVNLHPVGKGKPAKESLVCYAVTLGPKISVMRSDYLY